MSKVTHLDQPRRPIAIIAMACRLPGEVDGPEQLWELLRDSRDVIGQVPDGRWNASHRNGGDGKSRHAESTVAGGFLSGIAVFDAAVFGIAPCEATIMHPPSNESLRLAREITEGGRTTCRGHAPVSRRVQSVSRQGLCVTSVR
jgi:acyl transferase domain-containing protein